MSHKERIQALKLDLALRAMDKKAISELTIAPTDMSTADTSSFLMPETKTGV
jgi:hypothetical protein